MNTKINEDYQLFNISNSHSGIDYIGAQEFGKGIQRCGVLKDIPVTYSTSTKIIK